MARGGQVCRAAPGSSGFCWVHDPARGAERARARRAGGLARHTPHSEAAPPSTDINSVADVRSLLGYALAEALVMDNGVPRGRLLVAIAAACVEVFEVGELEQRLAALEAQRQ